MRMATGSLGRCLILGVALGLAGALAPAADADPGPAEPPLFDPMAVPANNWWVQGGGGDGARDLNDLSDIASGIGAILNKAREISTERWEVRAGAYIWIANIKQMEAKASSDDMRSGRANGFINHTHVTTRDFEKDFGISDIGDQATIINPEIMARWGPSVIRLSWWQWTGSGAKLASEDIAFGDRTYENGKRIEGDALVSDTKLIYEYRVVFDDKFTAFAGVGFHFIQTQAEFTYESAWGWDDHGCPLGSGSDAANNCIDTPPNPGTPAFADTEKPIEGVPLISISLRTEWKPMEGLFFTFDTQSMYLPFVGGIGYGYTDSRVGAWVQASRYVQIGVGGRFWFLWAQIEGLDKHDTEFEGRFEIEGYWAALMVRFP